MTKPIDELPPRAICEVLAPLLVEERRTRIDDVVDARLGGLTLLIENLHDPHNGAAVLRSAEAIGVCAVHVVEAAEPFRFSSDVTQGCEKWLDLRRHATTAEAYRDLKAAGFAVYAAVPDGPVDIEALDFARPAAIAVGNEHAGLTAEAQTAADVRFSLPMTGMTRSFNLSVATALAVSAAARKRRAALGTRGDLDEATRDRLRARYYAASVRGAAEILERYLLGAR